MNFFLEYGGGSYIRLAGFDILCSLIQFVVIGNK